MVIESSGNTFNEAFAESDDHIDILGVIGQVVAFAKLLWVVLLKVMQQTQAHALH